MSSTLMLARIAVDMPALLGFAHGRGIPDADEDVGYALHAVLLEAFGPLAPKPFAMRGGAGRTVAMLGYARADAARLRERLLSAPARRLQGVVAPDGIETRAMPQHWASGARLRFETRACPVQRQDHPGARDRSREVDVFENAQAGEEGGGVDRTTAYVEWLARECGRGGAARLLSARLTSFRRLRLVRRGPARALTEIERPEAGLAGVLQVADGDGFARLVERGIGRHRAFGFGMLLLAPA